MEPPWPHAHAYTLHTNAEFFNSALVYTDSGRLSGCGSVVSASKYRLMRSKVFVFDGKAAEKL